ncbi:fibroleukin-like [Ostrea edulis]|uniref:fibroleukin-like n=1 Tax=Ostrea edulis TaxID=37623 RepID=UPI0024AEEC4C|nr:fibroleukin-like [Ostrea edulis]
METAGGGWTAFQRRLHWSVKFNRTWEEYKIGFGIPEVDYWIGNDVIHQLTKGINSSLHVVIKLPTGETLYELYDHFSIADEANKYKLFLEGPATGTLGDSLLVGTQNLNGMYFSTLDQDNDVYPAWHCGAGMGGGWWFRNCCYAFLNGAWFSGSFGVSWFPKLPAGSKANETLLMVKPR